MANWGLTALALLGWHKVALGVGIFFISFVGSLALVAFLTARMPADYFHPRYDRSFMTGKHWLLRGLGFAAKNLAGAALILLGLAMSVPGVPGQGLLTILLGVVLLDFPGKYRLEQKLARRPLLLNAINGWRANCGKPPLILD